jgi:hypothetical protein
MDPIRFEQPDDPRVVNIVLRQGGQGGGGGGGGGPSWAMVVLAPGQTTVPVVSGQYYVMDLDTVGGNVTFVTTGLAANGTFGIKQVGTNVGLFTWNVLSPSAGSHIESQAAPGSLDTSFAPGGADANGQEVIFKFDGTNLWY